MPPTQENPIVIPPGFPPPIIPADDPVTPAKVTLGRDLFYATELSRDGQHSCGSCHILSASFCDPGNHWSFGVDGRHGPRNASCIVNEAYDTAFFWDGRAPSLEAQVPVPIYNPVELDNDSTTVIESLSKNVLYPPLFTLAFGDGAITMTRIAQAVASFERTMISGSSAYDQFREGDTSALSDAAKRGFALFTSSTTNCSACHSGVNFTDDAYHSTGLEFQYADEGREDVTHDPNDNGKFRTPTLRNIALTAPYMHDGRFNTLVQVLDQYNRGGFHNPTQDTLVRPLHLTQAQMEDIIAFLESLTDSSFVTRKDFSNPFN
ncbi:MAG TPA: cytochrome c peroxidase [Candidatus Kapabacteria bacterium]|nr:cytochrome c peroxidase [Candidatus Kapabacteria bacterium]